MVSKLKKILILSVFVFSVALSLSSCDIVEVPLEEEKNEATLTVSTDGGGEISFDEKDQFFEGDLVSYSIVAYEGYELSSVLFNGISQALETSGEVTLSSGENTLYASFSLLPVRERVEIATIGANHLSLVFSKDEYYVGDEIELTFSPSEWFKVDAVSLDGEEIASDGAIVFKAEKNEYSLKFDVSSLETAGISNYSSQRFHYTDILNQGSYNSTPSVGNLKIVVVPVEFSNETEKWDSSRLLDLSLAVNGDYTKSDRSNGYRESLYSYYVKSSYGAMKPDYYIADVVSPSFTSSKFIEIDDGSGTESLKTIDDIYDDITIGGDSLSDNWENYDYDDDGYIDGIIFIYNIFDERRVFYLGNFWAYTYRYFQGTRKNTPKNCKISTYISLAGIFNYEEDSEGRDAHTLIHESGHMLGLNDYYSYDDVTHSATGDLDMMDHNIGDHSSFSKYSLGWVEPYIAKEDTTITLKPFEDSGDCLIIPSGYRNDSAFSEYLIIELYTPTRLNELDSTTPYSTRELLFQDVGLKIYHIDARVVDDDKYVSQDEENLLYGSYVYASNTRSYTSEKRDLIALVDAKNRVLYDNIVADDRSLWKEGDVVDSETISNYLDDGERYSGDEFNYEIEITSLNEDGATLSIDVL
jgi:M6 family metalloprotease-like protein